MANKNRIRITYPSSEKIYIPGKIHKINVGMRKIKILDTVTRDENGELVHKKNNPVIVYDTSGPYSDPKIPVNTQNGIPRIRESWYAGRKDLIRLEELTSDYGRQRLADSSLDHIRFPKHHLPYRAKAGKNITQLYYAKRRIITPEMEYVAIRENQQIEALGLKSYITPEFVRKEVACMLKVSRRTLGEYRSNGTLPYYVLGGKVLYKRSEIEQVLEREYRSVGKARGSG